MEPNVKTLTAVLNCILPGDGKDWPAAGSHGLAAKVADYLCHSDDGTSALHAVLKTLGNDFCNLDHIAQTQALENLEQSHAMAFGQLITASYNMYYTDSDVRNIIEHLTGYEARPPQPLGYIMEPFDHTLLEPVRQRNALWQDESVRDGDAEEDMSK